MAKHRAATSAMEVFKRGFDPRFKNPEYEPGERRSDECSHGLAVEWCHGAAHYFSQ